MSDIRAMSSPDQALAALFAMGADSQRAWMNELSSMDLAGLDETVAAVATVATQTTGDKAEGFKQAIDKTRGTISEAWAKRLALVSPQERALALRIMQRRKEQRKVEEITGPMLARIGATSVPTVPPAYYGVRFAKNRQAGTDAPLAGLGYVRRFTPAFRPSWSDDRLGGLAGFTGGNPYRGQPSLDGLGSWLSEAFNKVKDVVRDVAPLAKTAVDVFRGGGGGGITFNPGAPAPTPGLVIRQPDPIAANQAINPSSSTLDSIVGVLRLLTGGQPTQYAPQPIVVQQPAPAPASNPFGNISPALLLGGGLLAILALRRN